MVAETTKKIIKQKGLKQKYVADLAGIAEKKFSLMLNGSCPIREPDIVNIAKALNVTPNDLFGIHNSQTY